MPSLGEHKTVQVRILAHADAIGWTMVSCEETERPRWLKERWLSILQQDSSNGGQDCPRSRFFDDWLDAKVREFNRRYADEALNSNGCAP